MKYTSMISYDISKFKCFELRIDHFLESNLKIAIPFAHLTKGSKT